MEAAAALIRRTRRETSVTQAELARRLGKAQATVASLERPGANPTLSTLSEALHALGHRLELRAVPQRSSVDDTLIARNLRLTPAERLAAFEVAHRGVQELRDLMQEQHGQAD